MDTCMYRIFIVLFKYMSYNKLLSLYYVNIYKNMNFRIKSININSETTENNSTKLMLVICYYNIFLKP